MSKSQSPNEAGDKATSNAVGANTLGFFGRVRSQVYDSAIVPFTTRWYAEVLDELPSNSRLLDVGVGTGAALVANEAKLRAKNITVVGVDYDKAYVDECKANIERAGLGDVVTCFCADFYDFTLPDERLFHNVYFSGSFMILPDSPKAVRKAFDLMVDREEGRLFFTQTFELQKNTMLEWFKPALAYVTSIDFGRVTYGEDFDAALAEGNAIAVMTRRIDDGKAVEGVRESRLVIARSTMYVNLGTESVA